jgi:hypothetical protein
MGGGCMCCAWRPGGRWHASERQLAWSGHSTSSWLQRLVGTMLGACAEEIGQVGQPSLSRHGLGPVSKLNWTALSSGPGPVNIFHYSKYFPIAFN